MPDDVRLRLDGAEIVAPRGSSVAAILMNVRGGTARRSVSGAPRGPLCGMGVCQECRVTIDGVSHRRACLTLVRDGMDVRTGGGA